MHHLCEYGEEHLWCIIFAAKVKVRKNQQRPIASYSYFIFWMLCKIVIIYYASKPGEH